MLRFYLRLATAITLMFTLCGYGLTALGSTRPVHPALQGFVEGCEGVPQPCWYGIVPGVTTDVEIRTILYGANFEWVDDIEDSRSRCSRYFNSAIATVCFPATFPYNPATTVSVIHILLAGTQLKLGDVMAILGNPLGYGITQGYQYPVLMYSDQVEIFGVTPRSNWKNGVPAVRLTSEADASYLTLRWYGFAPLWRYCQLEESNYEPCQ